MIVVVRGKRIKFNKNAMHWLGIWLDSQLRFITYVNKRLIKAKTAEIQVKYLSGIYGLASELVRQIQIAAIQ